MSYTTITNVAGMFPTFVRGASTQKPSDALIQTFIDDVAGDIDAILQKRFGETINENYGGSFAAFQSALSADALNVLEKVNRYGAAAQLSVTLATLGVIAADRLGKDFEAQYEELRSRLEARDDRGQTLGSGLYDHLFDAEARIESPRPGLEGIAGGDQARAESQREEGLSNYFGKFEKL
jgi:hypothetical protein